MGGAFKTVMEHSRQSKNGLRRRRRSSESESCKPNMEIGLRRRRCQQHLQQQLDCAIHHDQWASDQQGVSLEWLSSNIGEIPSHASQALQTAGHSTKSATRFLELATGFVDHLISKIRGSLGCILVAPLSEQAKSRLVEVSQMKAQKFDWDDMEHLGLMEGLWSGCGLDAPDWAALGFQGRDPSTDLRGLGVFGLRVLEKFVRQYPETSSRMLTQDASRQLPFAITGLNLIAQLERVLRADSGLCNEVLGGEGEVVTQYAVLLERVWREFDQFYRDSASRMLADGMPA